MSGTGRTHTRLHWAGCMPEAEPGSKGRYPQAECRAVLGNHAHI